MPTAPLLLITDQIAALMKDFLFNVDVRLQKLIWLFRAAACIICDGKRGLYGLRMLSETFLHPDTLNSELVMQGYEILRRYRMDLTHYSILEYVKSALVCDSAHINVYGDTSV